MQLCDTAPETVFSIHNHHKHGHLEKVFEKALAHRLRKLRNPQIPAFTSE